MSDEKKAAIERANAYRDMMQMWACKDLMKSIRDMKEEYLNKIDSMPLDETTPIKMAESRGARVALQKILDHMEFVIAERKI